MEECCLLTLFSMLSYSTQGYQPRGGTTQSAEQFHIKHQCAPQTHAQATLLGAFF